ncbi:MAG TPA: hypothetical protein VHZ50_09855 [Puia sp.]|nr:hypothetical protein [Puia sp.]
MKRIFLCSCVSACMLIPKNNNAQSVSVANKNETVAAYYYNDEKNSITSNVPLNELNTKAFRHFEKNYSGIDKETWTKVFNGIVVTFMNNGVFCKIFYNPKGEFVYSYKYYNEKNCSDDLTKMIGHVYSQYKIASVIELFDGREIAYGINITNGLITKCLEMKNDELKVINEFRNQ